MPYDLVLEHKERYCFPVDGDWKKKQATNKVQASRYSQLSLNGHLYKMDTSIRRTPGAGPGRFSVILL